jgi:hypothetical protein
MVSPLRRLGSKGHLVCAHSGKAGGDRAALERSSEFGLD